MKFNKIEFVMREGDEEIDNILRGIKNPNVVRIQKLISMGYPVDRLKMLLESDREEIIGSAVFIAAELGANARPLLYEVSPLLDHQNLYIRGDVIDVILTCANTSDGKIIADVILLSEDEDGEIYWPSFIFLVNSPAEFLCAALDYLRRNQGDQRHIKGLSLVTDVNQQDIANLKRYWESPDIIMGMYGTVVAARIATRSLDPDREFLVLASKSQNADVQELAYRFMKLL